MTKDLCVRCKEASPGKGSPYCNGCNREKVRAWRHAHPERARELNRRGTITRSIRGPRSGDRWTSDEDELLKKLDDDIHTIADQLGRSVTAIQQRRRRWIAREAPQPSIDQ